MAGKKQALSSSSAKSAMSTAKWLIPLLATGARWVAQHPEVGDEIRKQASRLMGAATNRTDGLLETVSVLREQVDYLSGSADDAAEERRAEDWARQLAGCERAAQLLRAPGATRKDRRTLKKKVEALRSEIFDAYIVEKGEDAEVGKPPRR